MTDFKEINGVLIDIDEILYVNGITNYGLDNVGFGIHFKNGDGKQIIDKDRRLIIDAWESLKFVLQEKRGKCQQVVSCTDNY